ncbi:hypothetical protein BG005_001694 [Podila minutissima]|nr:hypothetical protein BG005_001694 [Podila minutissima]
MVLRNRSRFISTVISLILSCHIINAQSFQPTTVLSPSSAFIEGRALYVTGGSNYQTTVSQTFSIDLSSSWDINAPKFKLLSSVNSSPDYQVPSALISEQAGWVVFSNYRDFRYNFQSDTWSALNVLSNLFPIASLALNGASDGKTMFVPNGYLTSNGGQNVTSMMQYDPVLGTTSSISMAGGPVDHVGFTVTWSTYLKKFVIVGGHQGNTLLIIYTFDPITSTWGVINPTNNPAMPARTFHCAAAAASGTRIVVMGGFTDVVTNPVTSDIAILDLTTKSWIPGQAISAANYGRAGPACGVSGDMVVIWGGERNKGVVPTNVTLVYNMKTSQWTSSFVPSTSSVSPPVPSGSNNSSSGSGSGSGSGGSGAGSSGGDNSSGSGKSSSNDGLIAGIAAGAVVVLLVAGFLIHRGNMKRRQEPKKNQQGGEQGSVTVAPISAIDANHIWQPPTIQPPKPDGSTLQNYQNGYEHYAEYDKHHSPSYPIPPSVTVAPSPSFSAYSPSHQQYISNGKDSNDGYIRPPSRSGPQLYSQEVDPTKVEFGEGHKASPSNARSHQAVSPVPVMVKEERNPQGLIVPNSYVD